MARVFQASDGELVKDLTRSFQSGHINVLLGAGASFPAIPLAGDVEAQIDALLAAGDVDAATQLMYELLNGIQTPINGVIDGGPTPACTTALGHYREMLQRLEGILSARRTTILPKQATVFTTNYDTLIDSAAKTCKTAIFANGFDRPMVSDEAPEYSSSRFFLATYEVGNFYEYRVELPTLSIVKLHGCLTWSRDGDKILARKAKRQLLAAAPAPTGADIKSFVNEYAVILPNAGKFNTTVLDRTYYELLRLYSNALDKENALLIAFGFSFRDEHILHITKRALKNPTLRILAVAYDPASCASLEATFEGNNNVLIVSLPDPDRIDFARFNQLLAAATPKGDEE